MLIDNNDIKKAKENLGDKNAILMAELLELDNFDENLSESENMKRNHYKKIYDCGSIKWIFKNR